MTPYAEHIAIDAMRAIQETAAMLFKRLDNDGVFGFIPDSDKAQRIQEIADFIRDGVLKMADADVRDYL